MLYPANTRHSIFGLKSILFDIIIATPAFFWFPLAYSIFSLCVFLKLKWVSGRQYIVRSFFFYPLATLSFWLENSTQSYLGKLLYVRTSCCHLIILWLLYIPLFLFYCLTVSFFELVIFCVVCADAPDFSFWVYYSFWFCGYQMTYIIHLIDIRIYFMLISLIAYKTFILPFYSPFIFLMSQFASFHIVYSLSNYSSYNYFWYFVL